jgi:acyl-lipid (7-3)-desaturase (Delta-4 desaturase)
MSTSPAINAFLGMCNDLIGGASLTWRYHHQVSHHIHTNDEALDEDVCSMYPLLRFDTRLPRKWCGAGGGVAAARPEPRPAFHLPA